jgi:hypothetical protein
MVDKSEVKCTAFNTAVQGRAGLRENAAKNVRNHPVEISKGVLSEGVVRKLYKY